MTESPSGAYRSPCCDAEPLGIDVRGVYDGVLYWRCTACGHAWQRWPDGDRLHLRAQGYIDATNAWPMPAKGDSGAQA